MIRKLLLILSVILTVASPAFALDLKTAKSQGLVGEISTGYLGVVKSSPAVEALVKDINSKRKAEYQRIAKKNGTALTAVEKLAGQKAINKTAPGNYIKLPSGSWQKK